MASGLLPFALGNDAGGSVRIPAALCGCIGLMASFYRMTPQGPPATCGRTLGQSGILAATAADAALVYAVIADTGAVDVTVPPLLHAARPQALAGLRVGVFWPWFEDCDAQVLAQCKHALGQLQECGARLMLALSCFVVGRLAHPLGLHRSICIGTNTPTFVCAAFHVHTCILAGHVLLYSQQQSVSLFTQGQPSSR